MTTIQFDRQEVVDKVTMLFWRYGMLGTSMQQVFQDTGLKPGSVYLAFGNKEGLFRESLINYSQRSINIIHNTITEAPDAGTGICRFFKRMVESCDKEGFCGCFLVRCQQELAENYPALHQLTLEKLSQAEAIFAEYLTEIDPELAETRAASIMFHIFGLRVYSYREHTREQLMDVLRRGMPWLPWQNLEQPKIHPQVVHLSESTA